MRLDQRFSVASELLDNERLVEHEGCCSLSSTFSAFIEFLALSRKVFEFFRLKNWCLIVAYVGQIFKETFAFTLAYLVSGSLVNCCPMDFGDIAESFVPSETSFVRLFMEPAWALSTQTRFVVPHEDELASVATVCDSFGFCLSCCRCFARRFLNHTWIEVYILHVLLVEYQLT